MKSFPSLICIFFPVILVGCNLFDPSENVAVKSSDTDMLVIEGQARFRDEDYEKAAEYFSAAIRNDSTRSEAWFGLSKANLYRNGGDPFELLLLFEGDESIPLMSLDSSEIERHYASILGALVPLRELIRRDTLTRNDPARRLSDRKVSYSNFSASYAILEFAYTILKFRKSTNTNVTLSLRDDGSLEIDANELYAKALDDSLFASRFNTDMDTLGSDLQRLVNNVFPELSGILDDSTFIDSTANTVEHSILFYRLGDGIDNDGDGCVDEEILDGIDNDGDGLIDEDLRLVPLSRNSDSLVTFIGIGADSLDHDMNGEKEDAAERTLQENGTLLFARDFDRISRSDSAMLEIRKAIALDTDSTNIRYPLETRKALVGRCWNNYSKEDFKAWFRNR